ncbi:hypothetical protein CTheo_5080 [Ceratobasidium theobromae]|uniref:Uncharacterized protein n=1 Tax=Ceratobasidium theobromae TaxID=1582974 RepID=A0A5N5QJ39_9AGAM|nr:hypothetical protein CTheo_5080 [Ceratobasidium theobromae]
MNADRTSAVALEFSASRWKPSREIPRPQPKSTTARLGLFFPPSTDTRPVRQLRHLIDDDLLYLANSIHPSHLSLQTGVVGHVGASREKPIASLILHKDPSHARFFHFVRSRMASCELPSGAHHQLRICKLRFNSSHRNSPFLSP